MKWKGQPFHVSIIQVYAPTTESDERDIELFYQEKKVNAGHIMDDFNAKRRQWKSGKHRRAYGFGFSK